MATFDLTWSIPIKTRALRKPQATQELIDVIRAYL
jgi:hypothetical protein